MSVKIVVTPWMAAPVTLEHERKEFVVGDSHGFLPQLDAVVHGMSKEARGGGRITFLGDMTDRGPDSLGCLELAARDAASLGFSEKAVLLGNHEIMLLLALADPARSMDHWVANGGGTLLTQMDIDPSRAASDRRVPALVREELGGEVMAMLERAGSHASNGNLLFVHAGVNPAVPLSEWFARPRLHVESEDHWAWIRYPFLRHEGPFEGGRVVVHGHTPEHMTVAWKQRHLSEMHVLDGYRIGLDGGSFLTGKVAGAEFGNGRYRLFLGYDPSWGRGVPA